MYMIILVLLLIQTMLSLGTVLINRVNFVMNLLSIILLVIKTLHICFMFLACVLIFLAYISGIRGLHMLLFSPYST